jgi:hypothetical protein
VIEILILFSLSRNIAAKAREKGRKGAPYVFLLLGFWFGGELLGGIAGVIVTMAATGEQEPNMVVAYVAALVTAIIGAVLAFQIVNSLAPVGPEARDDDEWEDDDRDDDRRPAGRRRRDE